jgi:hypothetical protein
MNTFYEHHKSSINLAYRCFDRILLNGLIQPFQQPERVIGFFIAYRNAERVTRNCLRDIAQQFQNWLKNRCEKWGVLCWMRRRAGAMTCFGFSETYDWRYSWPRFCKGRRTK